MKRLFAILLAAVALAACHRTEKIVETTAEAFLHAYYTAEYEAAAALCTPQLARWVSMGASSLDQVPEETAQKMKEALSQTSFTIVSVEVDEAAACALVRYELSAPGHEKPVPKSLKLQLEGRTALVDGIQ